MSQVSACPPGQVSPAVSVSGAAHPHFLLQHLWLPAVAAGVGSALLMQGGGDRHLADLLYALQGGRWLLRDSWITQGLIHHDGRVASSVAALIMVVLALVPWRGTQQRRLRRPAGYLALCVMLSTAMVSLLKRWTQMDCPWDISRYGGARPLLGLFESRHGLAASGCFPAGHASAGYAWVALYFVALAYRPSWRWPALAVGLVAGLVFGIAQQLRGAHFLSHDLWSLTICWLMALVLYLWMLRPARQDARNVA